MPENEIFFTQVVSVNSPEAHSHEFIECFFLSSGSILHFVDEAPPTQLSEGTLALLPTKVAHRMENLPGQGSTHRDLIFSLDAFNEIFSRNFPSLFEKIQNKEILLAKDLDNSTIECLNWYIYQINNCTPQNRLPLAAGLLQVIGNIFLLHENRIVSDEHYPPLVQDILFHIRNKSIFSMSWPEIFNLNHYSKAYTCKVFKKYTGITLTEYITKEKMRYAASLLLNTSFTVSEIMLQLNISSPAHFIKLFKKYFDTSPSDYRRRLPTSN